MAESERIALLGVRHHGPGCARQVVAALENLRPQAVLIEGPVDATEVVDRLADEAMKPPVALLCYPQDDPSRAAFWPFAVFSPEYQAILWALRNGRPVRFIDLPSAARFDGDGDEGGSEGVEITDCAPDETAGAEIDAELLRDPIGALASAAGYEDGESWWSELVEENPAPGSVFEAIGDAMTALRADEKRAPLREMRREAHMRLQIAAAARELDGPLAVVCGAWHVPALRATVPMSRDRELLKGMKKGKSAATWAPWTAPRLARASGYGAGVRSPGWYLHLWNGCGSDQTTTRWLAKIAAVLRRKGHSAPPASLIEAERLAVALAAIRARSTPGFEELRDAAIACLFHGEAALWRSISDELLVGADVGEIPDGMPLAPLLEDLKRQQKAARLKPEALERELSLDLRSDSGLIRSTLLHRLTILGVSWGKLAGSGGSRGTFREIWKLRWNPEDAVNLVVNLVYGPTIERAASGLLLERLRGAVSLHEIAESVLGAITADLGDAAEAGIALLRRQAAQSSDCLAVLRSMPALADIVRYGQARVVESGSLFQLLEQLATSCAIEMEYAARNLDSDAAREFVQALRQADAAVQLVEVGPDVAARWQDGLLRLVDGSATAPLVRGAAMHLLYEVGRFDATEASNLLESRLSPGTPPADAAAFFEGFFESAAHRLVVDAPLRLCVDRWLCGLAEDDFVAALPLFRRVFSPLDATERRRLLDSAVGNAPTAGPAGLVPARDAEELWQRQMRTLAVLFGTEAEGA